MVIKEPLLRVIIETEAYKAIIVKIEIYKESDRRFKGLNNSTDINGYNDIRYHS